MGVSFLTCRCYTSFWFWLFQIIQSKHLHESFHGAQLLIRESGRVVSRNSAYGFAIAKEIIVQLAVFASPYVSYLWYVIGYEDHGTSPTWR